MANRLFIDASSGVVEIEGEKEFVETNLQKLLPLIEACGLGARAGAAEQKGGTRAKRDQANDTPSGGPTDDKRVRRTHRQPPKGQSCAARMMTLRENGFFKEHRTPSEIAAGLAKQGSTHTSNQVSAAGVKMFERGDIQRTKKGKGFSYFWDRG